MKALCVANISDLINVLMLLWNKIHFWEISSWQLMVKVQIDILIGANLY